MKKQKEKNREAISQDRKKYLRKIKVNKIKILAVQIAILIIFILQTGRQENYWAFRYSARVK